MALCKLWLASILFVLSLLVLLSANAFGATAGDVCNVHQDYCGSSGDCPGSQFCRDRGDGVNLCMGDGGQNAFCSSSGDCAGSLFCKDRGDGMKMCMGEGQRNDFCSSSGDCAGSLFCKDRGDGLKVCM